MIKVTFPDQSVKEFAAGTTPLQIAESISQRLAQEVLAASVNGQEWDLSRPIEEDATIQLYKWDDPEGKHAFWHSSAHLMAEALQELYPGIKFGIGPAIENGFYYDVDPGETAIKEGDFAAIEAKMMELAARKEEIVRKSITKSDALKMFGRVQSRAYQRTRRRHHIDLYTGSIYRLMPRPALAQHGTYQGRKNPLYRRRLLARRRETSSTDPPLRHHLSQEKNAR